MRSSIFAKWVRSKKLVSYVILPSATSLVMIILYFSGSPALQAVISPKVWGIDSHLWTKYGLLEILQVVLLFCVLFYAIRCLMASSQKLIIFFVLVLVIGVVFMLLQETGYGLYYQQYFDRPPMPARLPVDEVFAPTAPPEAEQLAGLINLGGAGLMMLVLLITPMFSTSRNRTLRLVSPSYWMSIGAIAALLVFWIAWKLNSMGFAIIEGYPGALSYDITEFLQFSVYYLLLIYMATLHERIHFRENKPVL